MDIDEDQTPCSSIVGATNDQLTGEKEPFTGSEPAITVAPDAHPSENNATRQSEGDHNTDDSDHIDNHFASNDHLDRQMYKIAGVDSSITGSTAVQDSGRYVVRQSGESQNKDGSDHIDNQNTVNGHPDREANNIAGNNSSIDGSVDAQDSESNVVQRSGQGRNSNDSIFNGNGVVKRAAASTADIETGEVNGQGMT